MSSAPADFNVRHEWRAGPLPPPNYWEYTIDISPGGAGQISLRPDYPSARLRAWIEQSAVHPFHVDWLHSTMTENRLFEADWSKRGGIQVGGRSEWMSVCAAGAVIEVPFNPAEDLLSAVANMHESVRALVPEALWKALTTRREEYVRRYRAIH